MAIETIDTVRTAPSAKLPAGQSGSPLPKAIDLFAGCGGLSLGFQAAGFEVLAGFDNWEAALEVYNRNLTHPGLQLDLGDVETAIETLRPWMREADLIVGGPPCQDFSSAGKRIEAHRADLTEKFAAIVVALSPSAFVMENVERAGNAFVYNKALQTLRAHGYGVTKIVLDASLCGVPQKRKRLFAIGILSGEDGEMDLPLRSGLATRQMTLRDYFGESLGIEHYYRHPRSYARRGIFSLDEPSPTVRGVNRPVPPGYPGHPGDSVPRHAGLRPLTTKERARIQTFPDEYWFGDSKTAAEQMIGNAVPVKLAEYVASHLAERLRAKPSVDHSIPDQLDENGGIQASFRS